MKPGFVYAGTLGVIELQRLLEHLQDGVWLSWDLAEIGFERTLRGSGAAFNRRCEIRWERTGENGFRVLVLSDERLEGMPLPEAGREWSVEETAVYLVPLDSPQYNPPFHRYPCIDLPKGKLRSCIFYQGGMARFVSAREVVTDEG
jgi:hypothetical protein